MLFRSIYSSFGFTELIKKIGVERRVHTAGKNKSTLDPFQEEKKDVKNKDLWIELDKQVSKHSINWNWVKGHSGHEKNEIADALANKGIDSL